MRVAYRPPRADNTLTPHPNVVLPLITSLVAFAFCGVLLGRFVERRRVYYLVWTLGLLWYALATASEAAGGALGWNPGLYRLWYLTGAIGVAAYLGAGTVYLHRDPSFGSLTVVCVLGASVPGLVANHLDVGFAGLATAIVLTAVLSWRPRWFAHAVFVALVAAIVAAGKAEEAGGDERRHQSLISGDESVRVGSPDDPLMRTRRPSISTRPSAISAIARG